MRASWLGCLLIAVPATVWGSDRAAIERFEKTVRPLLIERCGACHGPQKQKGGLRLDTAEGLVTGGDSGPVVVAGKPEESPLIRAVRYLEDLKMPPKGRLSDPEIAALTDWVRSGAEWPAVETPKPDPSGKPSPTRNDGPHWAFQPIRDSVPPEVKASSWPKSPLDRFILAGLEKKGLAPAPPASKRDLIRRATFDLIGLPPTPEEVDDFVIDNSPEAFAKVIDRLLASPRYGERWGRHWLDLARYSDSNGMDENVAYANAFRYRDYVIRAFNDDRPYDQFLKEQIAGDLLSPSGDAAVDRERITATSFLVLGPKMLAEDDPKKMEMDIIDEQVDTVGRVFMGLTIGCARCHDHKFDPFPTTDYYALAGIFKSTRSMQNHNVVAMWNERPLGTPAEIAARDLHKKEVDRRRGELRVKAREARAAVRKENREHLGAYLAAGWQWESSRKARKAFLADKVDDSTPGAIVREAESFDRGNLLIDTTNYGPGIGVVINKGELPNFVEYDIEVATEGLYRIEVRHTAAEVRPVRMLVDGTLIASDVASTVTGSWTPEKQTWFPAGLVPMKAGRHTIRLDRDGAFPHIDKLAIVSRTLPAEAKPASTGLDRIVEKRSLNPRLVEWWADRIAAERERLTALLKPLSDPPEADLDTLGEKVQEAFDRSAKLDLFAFLGDRARSSIVFGLSKRGGPLDLPKNGDALFPPATAEALKKAREEISEFEKKAPPISQAMSVEDQKPTDLKVHIRGSHLTLGELVPRRFPKILTTSHAATVNPDQSGRLQLAEWLTSPDHPLTARVMVNRIWLAHFGEGLVRSPDNFGRLGEAPDHPELLDWLASRFVESRWSIKAMHRRIMLSATYQMSTRYDPASALVDPENRLLWRMSRRRLEAEPMRDAILAVSGELDLTMGGTLLSTKNHDYVNDTGARGSTRYDSKRRSVYLPVIRSGLYDVFQAFDFADPSASNGKRVPTTVAPQSLFMMNDPLVLRASEAMGRRLLAESNLDEAGRIRLAYLKAFGRAPSDRETARASSYLRRFETDLEANKVAPEARPARAWQGLCRAILASSEFLYLD